MLNGGACLVIPLNAETVEMVMDDWTALEKI